MQATTIGLDLAKQLFSAPRGDGKRPGGVAPATPPVPNACVLQGVVACVVGMEACASAHYWARELSTLGHTVRLMPATYVMAYAKRGKSDAIDAEAIREAVTRPAMRFVPIKSAEQQSVVMLQRTRDLPVRLRTMVVNALRGTARARAA